MMKRFVFLAALMAAIVLLAPAPTKGTITAGSISGITISGSVVYAGSGNEVTLNSSGLTFNAGSGANNAIKWSDGSWIYSSGDWLTMTGDVVDIFASTRTNLRRVRLETLAGGSGDEFVCVDAAGDTYRSATTCDGSAPQADVAALRAEVAELRERVAALEAALARGER